MTPTKRVGRPCKLDEAMRDLLIEALIVRAFCPGWLGLFAASLVWPAQISAGARGGRSPFYAFAQFSGLFSLRGFGVAGSALSVALPHGMVPGEIPWTAWRGLTKHRGLTQPPSAPSTLLCLDGRRGRS
jgi:hypothetical protein